MYCRSVASRGRGVPQTRLGDSGSGFLLLATGPFPSATNYRSEGHRPSVASDGVWPTDVVAADPVALVRADALTQTWVGLLALEQHNPVQTPSGDANAFHAGTAIRLDVWLHQVRSDARRSRSLDDPARHQLRGHAKRLRYAAEFLASL
jgi:hypothetical protein